jgi:O-succinylbenzoic acid--CoA ligase
MMLVRGLVLDLQLTVIPPTLVPLAAIEEDTHFDFLSFVPMQMEAILAQAPEKIPVLNQAKAILLGGAPVSQPLEAQLQHIQAPVYHTYGMTETISHIALRLLNTNRRQAFFTVLAGVTITTDARDCLVIDTPVLESNPVTTNDVVEILSPATFIWKGRIDNVINSGGIKVQAEKVEQAVEKVLHQGQIQRRFFVAGLPHPQLGEAVTVFVEGEGLEKWQEENILTALKPIITRYEIPKAFSYVALFPETPTGKIDKKRILSGFTGN